MTLIGDLFGRSPIRPMQEHMRAAVRCACEVLPLFEAMREGDLEKVQACRERIFELEHEADHLKNEIRLHLPKRLFLAVERRDMLEILDCQDSIADTAQDVAGLVTMRKMLPPEGLADPMIELVKAVIATCEQAEKVVNELDELVETGFGSREVERVEKMISELNQLESVTDHAVESLLRKLFELESELGVGTFFWYELLGWIGDIADYAERVGNRLRLMIAN